MKLSSNFTTMESYHHPFCNNKMKLSSNFTTMESSYSIQFQTTLPLILSKSPKPSRIPSQLPLLVFPKPPKNHPLSSKPTHLNATVRSPRGFGGPKRKPSKKAKRIDNEDNEDEDEDEDEDEKEEGVIPEVVTNRMIKRMGLSVGMPLLIGLCFFPFFYYLKVGLKIDVPNWVPFIVSFFFFGSALLGVSYGIVSSSWDPLREGSLLGWKEAQKNWPVFWQSLRGGGGGDSMKK